MKKYLHISSKNITKLKLENFLKKFIMVDNIEIYNTCEYLTSKVIKAHSKMHNKYSFMYFIDVSEHECFDTILKEYIECHYGDNYPISSHKFVCRYLSGVSTLEDFFVENIIDKNLFDIYIKIFRNLIFYELKIKFKDIVFEMKKES